MSSRCKGVNAACQQLNITTAVSVVADIPAGTIGGRKVGVAKGVQLLAARVCDKKGECSTTSVVAAINAVANDKQRRNRIISMSLGGDRDLALEGAVAQASAAGVLVVVAAGNEYQDACNVSPGNYSPPELIVCVIQDCTSFWQTPARTPPPNQITWLC